MNIRFQGKYKSITSFNWLDIPKFVVITGPNGTGKSHLLELIYELATSGHQADPFNPEIDQIFQPYEVTFLKGEWDIKNIQNIDLEYVTYQLDMCYNDLISGIYKQKSNKNIHEYNKILEKLNKKNTEITRDEFTAFFSKGSLLEDNQMGQKISEIFLNYRLSEIELQSKGLSIEEIEKSLGKKPWDILREIIKQSKLLFDINDPSEYGIRQRFRLNLTHQLSGESINLEDLSSGEKVLISLVFYLFNSQDNNNFQKLLLLDEPDAHLHPSMAERFLDVIKNVLVDKYDVQVIITTHSPSTVMLAPSDAIFEMSITDPRIVKSSSKNQSVSLLTSGLVYVGEGTRYFLVEDNDDVTFYSYVYEQLVLGNFINADIPIVFIPASTNNKSGGKDVVQGWIDKLVKSGLTQILNGLIDADSGNAISPGVFKIDRYSIENYLIDPIVVYATLIDKEKAIAIEGVNFSVGEEYKLKTSSNEILQKICDSIFSLIEPELKNDFDNFDESKEFDRSAVTFTNGVILMYPQWLIKRRGKTILNQTYNRIFSSPAINFTTLLKAFRKLNIFPMDLVSKLDEIKNSRF